MATSARIDELRKKFEENPRRYFALLVFVFCKAGDPERADAICEEYIPQQPGHKSGHIVYGQALFELGRYDEARQVFETALSLDPENLIALRHLGDIARAAGDAHTARVWYQRVLEADPRNEELAQLMMSLLATPVGSQTVDQGAPTPLNTAAVTSRPSVPTSSPAIESGTADPQVASTEAGEMAAPARSAPTPFPPPPVTPQSFVSRHAPKEEELLDLDAFDLGGVPLSSLRAQNAEAETLSQPAEAEHEPEDSGLVQFDEQVFTETEEPFVEQSMATDAPAIEAAAVAPTTSPEPDDLAIEKAEDSADAFEPDSFAIAAKPLQEGDTGSFEEEPPGTIELASDIDLGLPDDGGVSSTFADEEPPVAGLESFEAGILTTDPSGGASADAVSTESFFDTTADLGQASPDALVDAFVDDRDAFSATSAFSQVRDDTTESLPAEAEPIAASSLETEDVGDAPFSESEAPAEAMSFDEPVEHEPTTPAFPASFAQPTTSQFHE